MDILISKEVMILKVNKIILVSVFFLAIFTLGAVSASQDITTNETENPMEFTLDDSANIENQLVDENAGLEDALAASEEPKLEDGRRYAPDELYNDIDFDEQFSVQEFWHYYDYYDNPKETVRFESDGLMNGVMSLYFDDKNMFSIDFIENKTDFYADYTYEWFDDGVHTWMLKYTGDDYYSNFVRNGTFEIIWAKIPKVVEPGNGSDFIELKLGDSNVPATLKIINETGGVIMLNSTSNKILLSNLKSGVYNYTLSHINFHKCSGTFSVLPSMFLKTEGVYSLSDSINITAVLPEIPYGNISVNYNGKTYVFEIENGTAIISVENKVLGSNKITVTYDDDKYGPIIREKDIRTQWKTVIPQYMEFSSDVYVSLELPCDANGTLSVLYRYRNEKNEYVDVFIGNSSIQNGHADVSLANLEIGAYEIYAYYLDDDKYAGSSHGTVYVHPAIEVPKTMIVNQNYSINIKVPEGMGGTLTVYDHYESPYGAGSVSDTEIGSSAIKNNFASITFPCLSGYESFMVEYKSGNYTFSKIYPLVIKQNPELGLVVEDIYENQTLKVGISINTNATGEIIFSINNKTYPTDLTNGTFSVEIDNLTEGTYNATVKYVGDDCYGPQEICKTFNVNPVPQDPELIISANDIHVGEIESITLSIKAPTDILIVKVLDKEYFANKSGDMFQINITGLNEGNYTAFVEYGGDRYFTPSAKNATFSVSKHDLTIDIAAGDSAYGENVNVTVNVVDDASGFVTFWIDEIKNITLPIQNGKANWMVEGLCAGDYAVYANYSGDGKYKSNCVNETFKVIKANTAITIDNPKAVDADTNPIVIARINESATGNITLTVDGKKYHVAIKNGVATFTLNKLLPNNYNITAQYDGDVNNNPAVSVTLPGALTINKIGTILSSDKVTAIYGNSKKVVITLKDVKGNILEGKSISVKLNNDIYNAKTDSNGRATIVVLNNLAVKSYKATITFKGDTKYAAKTSSFYFVVKKATPKITASKKTFKKSTKSKKYVITLKVNGKVMKNIKVTLKVKGKTYTAKTNSKGKATFKITKLTKKGTYTAVVKYAGGKCYNAKTVKPKIIVK